MATENEKLDDVFLRGLLRQITEAEGFTGDPNINIKSGSDIGEGFHAINSAIEIQSENGTMKLFTKAATKNETIRRQVLTESTFGREIFFYENIYPAFLKFQTERKVQRPFDSAPRCYLTSAEKLHEILIFENLKEQGYAQYNKKVEGNDQVITSVFKLYARFHAVSFAMKDQDPELFAELSANLRNFVWALFEASGLDVAFSQICEYVKAIFDPVEDTAAVLNRVQNLTEVLMETLSNCDKSVDDYSVITHGDSWYNNFLFKYTANLNDLEDVKVIDWQLTRLNSPVLDLSVFFYGIATEANMDRLGFFLRIYYDALSVNMREMGSDPEKLYPYSALQEHWQKFSKIGLLFSFSVQKALLMEKEEMPKPFETVESGKNYGDAFTMPVIGNEDLYKQQIKKVVKHFIDNDFI